MTNIELQVCDIIRSCLPRLVHELEKANELHAIAIRSSAGSLGERETAESVDAVMMKK